LRPVALAAVHTCARETRLPIVGMGGVATGRHALELLAVGATDVAIGTALFADPTAGGRIRAELKAELAALGFVDPDDAVGVAHEAARGTLDHRSRVIAEKSLHTGANLSS
jgi:dihydroorotate dehydrogenase (NAD+) catalytic subunit